MRNFLCLFVLLLAINAFSSHILIPMDDTQKNHLKAYGISYWVLQNDIEVDWLLNYRGGSFMTKYYADIEEECVVRGSLLQCDC